MIAGHTLLESLWLATWTGSLAILMVLLLRGPVRRRFGAGIGYALWWLPVATWLALWLPARVVETPEQASFAALEPVAVTTVVGAVDQAFDMGTWGVTMWLVGVCLMIGALIWQQRRFEHALGRMRALEDERGTWQAQSAAGLPAVVGLLRPRIILPSDIDTRFDSEQRHLMLAHERIHLYRGDAWANAFVAWVRCVFWFNPLVHVAASRMRHDQELACDARVIAAHPHARRAYGEAMLKNAHPSLMAPLGCHWGITHPMKERVMLLKNAIPSRGTRLRGGLLVGLVALAVGAAAWAALPPRQNERSSEVEVRSSGRDYQAHIGIALDGGKAEDIVVLGKYGEPFTVRIEDTKTGSLKLVGTVTPATANGAPARRIEAQVHRDGKLIGSPALVVGIGKPARIKLGDGDAAGNFTGLDMSLQVGDVDEAALQARHQAEAARHEVRRTEIITGEAHAQAQADATKASADAERAAAEARLAADEASKAPDEAARMSADDARRAAEHARMAAVDAAEAAADAAAMAKGAKIERRIIRKHVMPPPPTPPVPPRGSAQPPAPPAPPASSMAPPPRPPAPPVPPNKTSVQVVRKIRGAAASAAPLPAVTVTSHAEAVAAGGRALSPEQAKGLGLEAGYRWVDVQSLLSGTSPVSLRLESAAMRFGKDGESPRYVGFVR